MKCPRCGHALQQDNIREEAVTYNCMSCTGCKGFWLNPQQLTEIEMAQDYSLIEVRKIPDAQAQMKPMTCPECPGDVVMEKFASFRDEKVVTDVCPTCKHVWLDAGEMQAIREDGFAANLSQLLARLKRGA
jgi:Zn-finger nucleic acid-binding protein